jgi:cold shock CspA family protein
MSEIVTGTLKWFNDTKALASLSKTQAQMYLHILVQFKAMVLNFYKKANVLNL